MTDGTTRMTGAGWRIRWNAELARQAYADGWWQQEICTDSLRRIATEDPDRLLVIDGQTRLTAADLHNRAGRLAQAMLARFAPGSTVSFMLPNWHEAAVIYMAATLEIGRASCRERV